MRPLNPILAGLFAAAFTVCAEQEIPLLKAGGEFYTNVTVFSVSATDVNFSHSRGIGNAKLKDLSPELQRQFKFDPVRRRNSRQLPTPNIGRRR